MVVLGFNLSLLLYMMAVGNVLLSHVMVATPPLIINTLAVFPYGSSLLLFNLLPSCWLLHKHVHTRCFSHQTFIKIIAYHVIVAMATIFIFKSACQECIYDALPKKPMLTAHRGCSMDAPENTLYSFEQSVKIPSVITLETDVQISKDGQLFLLHDTTAARTTNIKTTCPLIDPHFNASFLYYSSGKCPLDQLPIKANSSLRIPTLDSFLDVAKKYNKNVIFDLYLPHKEHPYRERYLQRTLDTIINSSMPLHKVFEWVSLL